MSKQPQRLFQSNTSSERIPATEKKYLLADMSSRGNSPLASPAMPIPVPLITPRYQRKIRSKNVMTIIPAASEEPEPIPGAMDSVTTDSIATSSESGSGSVKPTVALGKNRSSVNEVLKKRSEDTLQIKHGNAQYGEQVRFHTYEMFRHGSRQVQSRSVGYSSDGDLVMYKDEYALSVSDSEVTRAGAVVDGAVCLNPGARRPLTDAEGALEARRIKGPRFRKYPGIHCPKNRKIRNRLMNDHFANAFAKKIYNACVENAGMDDDLEMIDATRPTFPKLNKGVADLVLHVDEDKERRDLLRRGVQMTPPLEPSNPLSSDPNSGEYRFQQLNSKLRDELKNALGSEFLTQQIVDLEAYFTDYITHPPADEQPMVFRFRDGYGRLVCHGVASFYHMVSRSEQAADGGRLTIVSLPKRRGAAAAVSLPTATLLSTLQRRQGRSPVLAGAPSPIMPPFNLDDPVVYSEKHVDAAIQHSKPTITATQKKKLRKTMKEVSAQLEQAEEGGTPLEGQRGARGRHRRGAPRRAVAANE